MLSLVTGLLFLAAAMSSALVARQGNGLSPLWPANAIMLGMLLTQARRRHDFAAILGGGAIAGIGIHLANGDPLLIAALFTLANAIECLGAALILRVTGARKVTFEQIRDVARFGLACVLAPLPSATLTALALTITGQARFSDGWIGWYVAATLSLLVLTPLIVVSARLERRHIHAGGRPAWEVALVLAMVAVVTGLAFFVARVPLLFVVTSVVLVATFRLRAFGAVASVAIVAVISACATAEGLGPIPAVSADPARQILFLQIFLAVTFIGALPVAATLAERDASANEARRLADRFKAVVENIGEVIFRTDRDGRWAYLNPAWETLTGYRIVESLGRSWLAYVDEADRAELADRAEPMFEGKDGMARRVLRFHTASGGVRWMELFIQALRDEDGTVLGTTGTLRDIDDRKRLEDHVITAKRRAEQRAREATLLASTDELTGLANRRAFLRQLTREMEGAAEFGWPLAVAMFDVDHFKKVNDRHGHAMGDRVLQAIATRAVAVVRAGDLVGRLGGEEFGILMPGASAADASAVAERLREAIEVARGRDDAVLPQVTVSIGIAARDGQSEALELLAVADAALYAAKGGGRNRVSIAA